MKKILLFLFVIPFSLAAQVKDTSDAEGANKQKNFVKFTSISGFSGGDFYRDGYEDRTIFQQAVPNSTLANADINGYTNFGGYSYYMTTGMSTGLMANLHLRCQKKFGELRFGFSHSSVEVASQYYSLQEEFPLGSTQIPGGQTLYSDSIATSNYSYGWNSNAINLHVGWIIRSTPRKWFSLYTGIGFYGGLGYNGVITMQHSHYSYHHHYTTQSPGISYTTNSQTIVSNEERFRAPGYKSFGIYTPIGLNLRLGRHGIFRQLTIFGEYNGAIQWVVPEGTISKMRTVSTMSGGVRWYVRPLPNPGKGKGKKERRNRRGWSHGEEHMNREQVD